MKKIKIRFCKFIPNEIVLEICSFIFWKKLFNVNLVCGRFNEVIKEGIKKRLFIGVKCSHPNCCIKEWYKSKIKSWELALSFFERYKITIQNYDQDNYNFQIKRFDERLKKIKEKYKFMQIKGLEKVYCLPHDRYELVCFNHREKCDSENCERFVSTFTCIVKELSWEPFNDGNTTFGNNCCICYQKFCWKCINSKRRRHCFVSNRWGFNNKPSTCLRHL